MDDDTDLPAPTNLFGSPGVIARNIANGNITVGIQQIRDANDPAIILRVVVRLAALNNWSIGATVDKLIRLLDQ